MKLGVADCQLHPIGAEIRGSGKARETERPLRDVPVETQQQVGQQPRPDLPFDRLLVIADEVPELERLLEFLEESLDGPARPVQFRDRPPSQHFFCVLKMGAEKIVFGVDYFAPPGIICANHRCWNVSGKPYGMLVNL